MNESENKAIMHYTRELLLEYLYSHQIMYTLYTHPPMFTCEQSLVIIADLNIPGTSIKNLFLKDNKKRIFHIVATDNTKIDLKRTGGSLDAKGLRFAEAELLRNHLGVEPGSVTPLALINDKEKVVQIIIDADLLIQKLIQVHPLKNDTTVVISPEDLSKFFSLIGRSYIVYDFTQNQIVR